ncbi:DUF3846 domain-containing protein [Agromyces bauzanensis]
MTTTTETTTGFLLVPVEGPVQVIEPGADSGDTLRKAVGGWFECVGLEAGLDMWLNEEGKLEGLPHNRRAQGLWDATFGAGTDYIVGPAVLSGGVDDEGDTLPLDAATIAGLVTLLGS